MDYVACSNVMLDRIEGKNDEQTPLNLSGPALFALSGMRIWTENCKIACRAGADFDQYFAAWMDRHGLPVDCVDIETEHNILHLLKRRGQNTIDWLAVYGAEHKGYLRVTPELIDRATDHETKGIYLMQDEDIVFWRKLYDIKTRKGFKIMWENEEFLRGKKASEKLRRVKEVLPMADLWSVSLAEAARMFNIAQRNEEDIVNAVMKMPVQLTLLRLGNNGSWAVTPTSAAYCEAIDIPRTVDPLGCGSTASGAALVAHCEGYNAARVAVMANVAAGYTAAHLGVVPRITDDMTRQARQLADAQYKKVTLKKKQWEGEI